MGTRKDTNKPGPVAIIGMAGMFAKSSDLKEYWRLLSRAEDGITEVPPTHWSTEDFFNDDPKKPDHVYCKRGGFLPDISFDPAEFGIPPSSLEATDTSQLLGLVAAKEALKDAGYDAGKQFDRDRASVIIGVTGTQELVIPLGARLGHPIWRKALDAEGVDPQISEAVISRISDGYVPWQENSFPGLLGNVVAGRICNRLDFGGTNCVVDAACASSMSAINLSILELEARRSDMVITGGIDTLNDIFMHMCFAKTQILSPTGDAKPFSSQADGTVLGEGVGLIVLKRLADAERDQDRIYAVIKALRSSSDGKSQSIYAPRAEGQEKALRRAYRAAGVDPATIGLVEAHGTGTRVGDAVEFSALKNIYSGKDSPQGTCAIGSVKSNIGHTKAAAGAAGLIKAALAVHHKVLLPTIKANEPDPKLDIGNSPFYLNTTTRPWLQNNGHPRRSGVSAFGFGGSNFHMVIEEHASEKTGAAWDGSIQIAAFSGPDRETLKSQLDAFTQGLGTEAKPETVARVCFETRRTFEVTNACRLLMMIDRETELTGLLAAVSQALEDNRDQDQWQSGDAFFSSRPKTGKLAFLFPGQGSQYVNMARDLACCFPEVHAAFETANAIDIDGTPLGQLIFPRPAASREETAQQEDNLRRTDAAQPAIGATSLGMYKILNRFNIKPDAAAGHSYGELTALFAAGRLDEETFFRLSSDRGRFMAAAGNNTSGESGTMLAVRAPLEDIESLLATLDTDVILANRNSPTQGVLSGSSRGIKAALKACREKGFRAVKLPVAAAFHSHLVENAREPFEKSLAKAVFTPADIPVFANTTGAVYPENENEARATLGAQLVSPVHFKEEIDNLYKADTRTFLEVGPKPVLTGLVRQILKGREHLAIALDQSAGKTFGLKDLAKALCRLAAAGHTVDLAQWEPVDQADRKPVMDVPISGANVKNSNSKKGTDNRRHSKAPTSKKLAPRPPEAPKPAARKTVSEMPPLHPRGPSTESVMKETLKNPQQMALALKTVQEGMKTLQSLQMKTAETHQKFLDTQAQASKALQQMMRATGRLAGLSDDFANDLPDNASIAAAHSRGPVTTPAPEKTVTPPATAKPQAKSPVAPTQTGPDSPIPATLLAVVSRLTGYPAEMLNLDMDIEADLGIDSIKRVEILSTLEEEMPGLPSVGPEMMGSLKTLGQIVDYLSETDSPAGSPAPPVTPAPSNQADSSEPNEILSMLLAVVSELTGYPVEMLKPDMDIESDLGIDSIKRVEILSTMEERMPGLPQIGPEMMGTLNTLGHIVDFLAGGTPNNQDTGSSAPTTAGTATATVVNHSADPDASGLPERSIITPVNTPADPGPAIALPAGKKVWITSDNATLAVALEEQFSSRGFPTVLIDPEKKEKIIAGSMTTDDCGGLIITTDGSRTDQDLVAVSELIESNFLLTQAIAPHLMVGCETAAGFLATLTDLDGAFGFLNGLINNPASGGLAALAKTAGIEWPQVHCVAFDIDPGWHDTTAIAKTVTAELLTPDPSRPAEIGLTKNARYTLAEENSEPEPGNLNLAATDVAVITGGARGISAAAAIALARQTRCTTILIGRSAPLPTEPDWIINLSDEAAMKKAILEYRFKGNASPREIEDEFRSIACGRSINQTIQAITNAGGRAAYFPADVRDKKQIRELMEHIRTEYGPIRAILHGAGVLEDRLIADKTIEQFKKVYRTKVFGLASLLDAVTADSLNYLVLFSSVSARTGNRGQVDYAIANEVLNKLSRAYALEFPDCKVAAINWGPWDGGMVSPALKKEFLREGVNLIPLEGGVKRMLQEMAAPPDTPVETIVGATLKKAENQNTSDQEKDPQKDDLALLVKHQVDTEGYPVLASHILAGRPVVPFALIAEWLGHGALHDNPGLLLHGLDDMRLFNGIKLDKSKKTIRLLAGKAYKADNAFAVDVQIRNGRHPDGSEFIHSSARAILTDQWIAPPQLNGEADIAVKPYHRDLNEVYEKILFHGNHLHGINNITGYSEQGIIADVATAPSPMSWITRPLRSRWIADPLALDSAFQLAIIWCYETKGLLSLPSYAASYRQYRDRFPDEGIRAILKVNHVTASKMTGDFTFIDANDEIIAKLSGCEAIMDTGLQNAFKN
ncbi:MAG: SDR family NAD(P)-dependent oxidoreductase [Desulfobacterales bacterium]|nr:SDR family NAD(P)-dependent oxidoreductase [Desulfobacterales bacterium]